MESMKTLQNTLTPVAGVNRFAPVAPQQSLDFRAGQQTIQNFADGGVVQPMQQVAGLAQAAGAENPAANPGPVAPQIPAEALMQEAQRFASQNPEQVQAIVAVIQKGLQSGELTMEALNMVVELAKAAAQNPQMYPKLRQLAIQKGLGTEQEIPPDYDQGLIMSLLIAGETVKQGAPAPATGPAPTGAQPQAAPQNFAVGGHVPVSASPVNSISGRRDDVPINVSGGEYVVPKHVVMAKGTDFFDKLDPAKQDAKKGTA